jgi:hypothetical protein
MQNEGVIIFLLIVLSIFVVITYYKVAKLFVEQDKDSRSIKSRLTSSRKRELKDLKNESKGVR